MLNRVILIGRLTRDPDLRYTPSGAACTQFTLAVDRQYKTDGQPDADFIPIVTWRQLAEACANYLAKGRLCAIEGRISVRNYENNEGKRVYVTEVIADNVRFLESNRSGNQSSRNDAPPDHGSYGLSNSSSNNSGGNRATNNDPFKDDGRPIDISEDDLPF